MESSIVKKLGAAIVVVSSFCYALFRISSVWSNPSWPNVLSAFCEITLVALVSVEATLMATRISSNFRKQDENVLIESAKTVLFSKNKVQSANASGQTKLETEVLTSQGSYQIPALDVVIFAEDATLEQLRRCFLSIDLMDDIDNVYLIDPSLSSKREELAKEFSFHVAEALHNIVATTENVLICRGTDILYPDACKIARTYNRDQNSFLELRSVYSDERALGVNGVVEVSDKRQMIRESLSTRGLATWSTGPAVVSSETLNISSKPTSSAAFFRACEKNGIHGLLTEEVVSEEISHEQTISEVEWRALDFSYSSRAWMHSYKRKGSRAIGLGIKTWSMMINASLIRRLGSIALILGFVVFPQSYGFIDATYLGAAVAAVLCIYVGSFLAGDKREPFARIREYYFDVEAAIYNLYKKLIKPENRASNESIVKKLPSVSALLILTDAILVWRVWQQNQENYEPGISLFLKNVSLFSGFALIVSLLVGLGMVIVHQTRNAIRREVSRGANIDSEPVSMIDLSPGGAGVVSVAEMPIDSEVDFESSLPIKTENVKFKCKAIVRSCVKWNDSYRIGLEFSELEKSQNDVLETYCSVVYPHTQSREHLEGEFAHAKPSKINGKPEKRFLSYAASFIALGAIIFSNLSVWR